MTALATTEAVYDLGHLGQIPEGEGRCFVLGRVPVAIFRTRRGEVYATQARCTHQGGPLADGLIGGETLVCPLHAFKFNLVTGQSIGHECKALKTYAVSVSSEGMMSVTLPENPKQMEDSAAR